jgi:hypothetical protein
MRARALFPVAAALTALAACESGTSEWYEITVPDGLAEAYSEEEPGLIRASPSLGGVAAALCGQTLAEPVELYVDYGFGCLEEGQRGTEETRTVWVEPVPEGWDRQVLCAATPDPWQGGLALTEGITRAQPIELAATPDAAWPQVEATGTWRRDGSPCGGRLRIEATLPELPETR